MSKTGKSLIKGMKEALAYSRGARDGYRVTRYSAMDVAEIRKKSGLTQRDFANTFLIPLSTLRKWEQGQRVPQGPTQILLHVIAHNPKAVLGALS